MYLFGLEGSGFIISLGLTLLISGAIMFYVLNRFQLLESSIIDNAKILQLFINKNQEQQINNNLASNIALESAIKQQNELNNKIEVSDNEYSDNESNKDTDDSDDDEKIEFVNNNILSEQLIESVKIIAINDFEELKSDKLLDVNNIEDLETVNFKNDNNHDNDDDDVDNDDDLDDDDYDNDNNIQEISNKILSEKKDEKLTNYTRLKIQELKELVISKKILDKNTDINKLKKQDLVKLLQNN